jgi:predicted ATP-grasp superfamily ATP-dependent carboligase
MVSGFDIVLCLLRQPLPSEAFMRVLLYEWCCAGGMHQASGRLGTVDPATAAAIAGEGRAMLMALVADAAKCHTLSLTLLADASAPLPLPTGTRGPRLVMVPPGQEASLLCREAAAHDWTLIIAPETDGILVERVSAARASGGKVAASGRKFLATASSKQATVLQLAAGGVPVPAGCTLAAEKPLPMGFHLPAVQKAVDGVGCDGLAVLAGQPAPVAIGPRRVEAFVPGVPVGVSCLCGPRGIAVLPPVLQHFSAVHSFSGGSVPVPPVLSRRAEELARRAITALSRPGRTGDSSHQQAAGWVGVDMILGAAGDGSGDRVLEVNPRLTTSFVGLAHLSASSLLAALLAAAGGEEPQWAAETASLDRGLQFGVDGNVIYGDGTGTLTTT